MSSTKEKVQAVLGKLPDDCTLEDVQYHLYVLEKIQRGIDRADNEGTISQEQAEKRLDKWLSK
mgnify:FL=1